MAQNKILPWAQTGTANVLSDDAYAADVATGGLYGDGVKTGQASSQQANKTWRQATAPASGLGQFLVDNLGVDVTDADTPATFSSRIANAVLKLAQISPFNQSWATATGGYRKYAIVSDSSGNFWVSTADANTTVPGAAGANWKSLFDGYATQAWAQRSLVNSGGGIGQNTPGADRIYLGWSKDSKLKVTVDETDLGNIALESWVGQEFVSGTVYMGPTDFRAIGMHILQNGHPIVAYIDANNNICYKVLALNNGDNAFSGDFLIDAPASQNAQIQFTAGGSDRWNFGRDGAAESGTSTGSNFVISRFNNSGGYIDSPFGINRETGVVSANVGMTVPDVTDFTGENALNAKTAEGRYVKSVPVAGQTRITSLVENSDGRAVFGDGTKAPVLANLADLPFSDTGLKEQAFVQWAPLDQYGHGIFTFPTAFRAGTVPVVTLTIDCEPTGTWVGHSRTYTFVRNGTAPSISNTGFMIAVGVTDSGGVYVSTVPVIAHIRAVGYF